MPAPKKRDWQIYSKLAGDPEFRVNVGNCTEQHALSVAEAVMHDPMCPHDLFVVPVLSFADPTPIGEEIECVPPKGAS